MRNTFVYLSGLLFLSNLIHPQPNPGSLPDHREKKVIFINANVFADSKTLIKKCSLAIENDKIIEISSKPIASKGFEIIDLKGKYVYPAFIDLFYPILPNDIKHPNKPKPQYESAQKGNFYWNQAIRPELTPNPYLTQDYIKADELKKKGFSHCQVLIQDGIVRGASSLIQLSKSDISASYVLAENETAMNLSFYKGSSTQEYPTSRMGAIALLRQFWEETNYPNKEKNSAFEVFNRFQGKPYLFEITNKNDLVRAEKISTEWKSPFWIKTNGDEYQSLAQLNKIRSKLIVPAQLPNPLETESLFAEDQLNHVDLLHWKHAPYRFAYMEKNKLEICITSNGSKDDKTFFKELRTSIKNGASHEYILRSLTENPAKWLKKDAEIGTLNKGKQAHFFISNAPIWDSTFALMETWVDGIPTQYSAIDDGKEGDYLLLNRTDSVIGTVHISDKKSSFTLLDSSKKDLKIIEAAYVRFYEYKSSNYSLSLSHYSGKDTLFGQLVESGKNPSILKAIKKPSIIPDSSVVFAPPPSKTTLPTLPQPFNAYGWEQLPKAKTYLIKNATLWTMEGESVLENHDLLIHNGKIKAIGKKLETKDHPDCTVIDGTGMHVTPGLIDEHSHIAINGGVNESGQSITSEVRIADVLNGDDINILRQLAGGVTTAHILHGSANCIGGQSALIKLRWGKAADSLLFEGAVPFIKFALGENVKQSNWGDNYHIRYPQTRMGVEQTFIDAFSRAQEYKKKKTLAQKSKKSLPLKDWELEALVEILEGKRMITCHSYSQSEINMLIKVAERFGFKINTFTHVLEGYKIADKLKNHGAAASSFSDWWAFKTEVKDAIPYNAALLTKMGVLTAINSDDPEAGRRLNQEAAKTIKYGGLTEIEALRLVTINPAKILKIDHLVGSLKENKSADVVIWSDNPTSVYAKVVKTWVDGVLYYDSEMHTNEHHRIIQERKEILELMKSSIQKGEKPEKKTAHKQHHYHCDDLEE